MIAATASERQRIRAHWESETCGVRYGDANDERLYFQQIRDARYALEPQIRAFQDAPSFAGKDVLELGVGAGSDFLQWIRAGARPVGLDFTHAAVQTTRRHLRAAEAGDRAARVFVGDAEALPFSSASFDLVYAYGVVHHSANTERALAEACRVLRPNGRIKAMIYHVPCWTGWMLWTRYALLTGRVFQTPRTVIYNNLESPATKAYTVAEAHALMRAAGFGEIRIRTVLGPGDLLQVRPSHKYQSAAYRLIWRIYPRWLVRLCGDRFGGGMFVEAAKI